ncbi:hypothetical protein [Nonomuraea sp. NPDC049709]|uniref:hypothetical protein n=1 Tax=Nonomuraea sp. NPDC049709 TaxID=3154736 RepID=UPI00341CDF36
MLEGQIGFRSGADEVVVGPGGGLHETPEFTELATRYGLTYGDQAGSTTSWPVTG